MRARLVVALVALAGLAAGTSRSESTSDTAAPTSSPTVVETTSTTSSSSTSSTTTSTTTTTLPPTFPLSGRTVDDPARLDRPAVAVKIDNVAAARPQSGIDRADVVFEEFTEGVTRLIVIFHSQDADVVGPVRSVRPADATIVTPLVAVLGMSGGSPAAVAVAQASPLTLVTEGNTDVMYRRAGRSAPHNLYSSTGGLRDKAPPDPRKPARFSRFVAPGASFGAAEAVAVTSVSLAPAPFLSAGYAWDAGTDTWLRSTDGAPHVVEGGVQVAPANVILQYTSHAVFVPDPQVQYPEVVGAGEAWILSHGLLAKAKWWKPSAEEPTLYTDPAGAAIALQPGLTWVHFLAPEAAVAFG